MNPKYIPFYTMCKSFLMDSGAFTVMNSKKSKNSFEPMEFTKKYAQHIKENNVQNFLELDIDGVFGFEVYRDCLHCLQDITGRDPIPVYHKWRGVEYYKELVKKYDYIAIGDVSIGAGSRELYKYFPWFLNEAHKNNCKVHGLAFTSLPDLQFMPFDSVDSSSWKVAQDLLVQLCSMVIILAIMTQEEQKKNSFVIMKKCFCTILLNGKNLEFILTNSTNLFGIRTYNKYILCKEALNVLY